MARIETWFNQDLQNAVKVHYLDGNVFSQDNNGNKVGVRLYDGETPVNVSGSISANIIRADGVTVSVSGSSSSNQAWVILPQSAYAIPGIVSIIIKSTNNSDISTLCAIVANVYQSTTDSIVDPGTIIPSIESLIEEIETAIASVPADYSSLWASVAPLFSTSVAYHSGQIVRYDGNVYKFILPHSGSWSSSDAVLISIGGELYKTLCALTNNAHMESGGFNDTTGIRVAQITRIRTQYELPIQNIHSIKIPTGYQAYIYYYDKNLSYLGHNGWYSGNVLLSKTILANTVFINVLFKKTDEQSSDISQYVSTVENEFVIYSEIQKLIENTQYYYGTLPNNSNVNDMSYRSMYGIDSSYTYSNKPPIESGYVITYVYNDNIRSQLAFELNFSKVYARRYINSAWSGWSLFNITGLGDYTEIHKGVLADNTDFDTLTNNAYYGIRSDYEYPNSPIYSGILRVTRYSFTDDYCLQTAYEFGGDIYQRRKLSSWSQWVKVSETNQSRIQYVFNTLHNDKPDVTDLNDVKENGKWGLGSNVTFSNNPLASGTSGWLECYVFQSDIYCQHVWNLEGTINYTRYYINGWSAWFSGDGHDLTNVYYAFGDSTTYGQIGGVGGQSPYNYPKKIGQLLKMTVKNKAVGGQGLIKDWDYIHSNYINGLDMSDAKLITVGWSYNDSGYYSGMAFGSYDDTGSSSYIGKYYTIMREFQSKCPTAQIVLITGYGYPDGQVGPPVVKPTLTEQFTHKYTFTDGQHSVKEMYDTLEAMCNLHGFPCVNQAKGTCFNQWNANTLIGDQIHPNNDGYVAYSNLLSARVSQYYGNLKK